ncbi:uncharacterized protein VICG_00942 [Vittaforma corneae ATCC 50505]|uniref:Deacetylase sirtuin-type domain-containing protein n=1 Tax=Vittaforma corneae (strain ATCC 50505) TaxID=993615 RepID=L2GMI6_VITCO|nr:uncharacterized protein VICG_00942 [Vittaforma corneae ATCC 50505]ELA42093.1 hypothetical protein VICG_00942 [Vittaforma corneae ATCC 50505]
MRNIDSDFLLNNKSLLDHKKCVFVVGAGISVASGIPDFRSPTGIFASLRQQLRINGRQLFTYNFGIKEGSRQIYLKYISSLKRLCDSSHPNVTHHFLANFPKSRTYTQNIDGLEESAGMAFTKKDGTKGVYLHGNLSFLVCQYCGFRKKFNEADMKSFENGDEIACSECSERRTNCMKNGQRKRPVGVLHPGIIHYQQIHPDGAFISKICEKDMDCDLLIVIGTSLAVEGVKKLVKMFCKNQASEGKRILVNLTKPSKEWGDYFDYFYEGDCAEFARTVGSFVKMPKFVDKIQKKDISKDKCDLIPNRPAVEQAIKPDNNDCVTNQQSSKIVSDDSCIDTQLRRMSIANDDAAPNTNGKSSLKSLESKLEVLSQTFSDEEAICQPVLDELLENAAEAEVHASFCTDLQDEIENIVAEHASEEKPMTPKKKKSRKNRRK